MKCQTRTYDGERCYVKAYLGECCKASVWIKVVCTITFWVARSIVRTGQRMVQSLFIYFRVVLRVSSRERDVFLWIVGVHVVAVNLLYKLLINPTLTLAKQDIWQIQCILCSNVIITILQFLLVSLAYQNCLFTLTIVCLPWWSRHWHRCCSHHP